MALFLSGYSPMFPSHGNREGKASEPCPNREMEAGQGAHLERDGPQRSQGSARLCQRGNVRAHRSDKVQFCFPPHAAL